MCDGRDEIATSTLISPIGDKDPIQVMPNIPRDGLISTSIILDQYLAFEGRKVFESTQEKKSSRPEFRRGWGEV